MAETLQEKDYVAWLQDQAEKLRSPNRNTLDWQTLAEELEEMVDERKYKAESFLIQLLSHLLLYAYWKHPYYLPHWTDEIDNFRLELSLLFRSQVIYNAQRRSVRHLLALQTLTRAYQELRKSF